MYAWLWYGFIVLNKTSNEMKLQSKCNFEQKHYKLLKSYIAYLDVRMWQYGLLMVEEVVFVQEPITFAPYISVMSWWLIIYVCLQVRGDS